MKDGDVVVIRYEGPRGGPGMQEMLSPTAAIVGAGIRAALITDGRFSRRHARPVHRPRRARSRRRRPHRGGARTATASTSTPHARRLRAAGRRRRDRSAAWRALPPFEPKVKRGWLARYLLHVTSADTGAVFEI